MKFIKNTFQSTFSYFLLPLALLRIHVYIITSYKNLAGTKLRKSDTHKIKI